MHCDFCEREVKTHLYLEDNICWIVDCESCKIPLVVYKKHGICRDLWEQVHMENKARELFGKDCKFIYETKIKDHFHFHVVR